MKNRTTGRREIEEMSDIKGIVIVQYDERGEQYFHVVGDDVQLFIVDERCPNDRVYEWLTRDTADDIKAILKDDPIGSSNDDRHAAIRHKVLALIDGKPRLSIVKDTP